MLPTPPDIAQRRSDAISIARVICILGVVYVHAWTGRTGEQLAAMSGNGQEILRWILMEGLGKSAVPLLGIISGYLVAGSSRTRDWRGHISGKARTILLPMLLWNALAILFVSGAAMAGWILAPVPHSIGWVIEEMLALTRAPDINVQMPFLRDLFVCMVAAPLLVRLPNRGVIALAVAVAILTISGWPQPLLLRPIILFFFLTGMMARRTGLAEWAASLPLALAALPFLLLLPPKIALSLPPAPYLSTHFSAMAALDLVTRIAAALFFWRCAWALAASRARTVLLTIEPYAFFLFCCHLILIWLGGPLLGSITGPVGSPLYPVFLILQPLIVLGASIVVARAVLAISPPAARILSGGRLARAPRSTMPVPSPQSSGPLPSQSSASASVPPDHTSRH